jgi:hypothetical protein
MNRCCGLVMKLASEPDHLYPFSCLFRNPLLLIYLTIPFFPARNAGSQDPCKPDEKLTMAGMQIRLPGARTAMPPLVELGVKRRVAPSHRPGWRRPLGEHPHPPAPS